MGIKEKAKLSRTCCELCGKPFSGVICPACADRVRAAAVARKKREDKGLE